MIPRSLLQFHGSRARNIVAAAAAIAVLAGCSTYDSLTQRIAQRITPYRITIVQGNFVSQETASQLKVGMTRDQVRALLGTPLLTDMFHADRWDYLFYFKRGSTSVVQQRDLVLHFSGDRLASWTGAENLPSNLELLADIDGDKGGKKAKARAEAAAAAAASAASQTSAAKAAQSAPAGQSLGVPLPPDLSDANANAEAARAANRATSQVPSQSVQTRGFSPSMQAAPTAPTPGGLPPGANPAIQPQFQFHRPPPPATPSGNPPPVGPTGADNPGAPLTAPAAASGAAAPTPASGG